MLKPIMKLPILSACLLASVVYPVFAQSASDLLVLDPPKPYNSTMTSQQIYDDFHRRNNAILSAPLTGCAPADKVVQQQEKQTKLLKEQNSILEAQLLIMQRDASKPSK